MRIFGPEKISTNYKLKRNIDKAKQKESIEINLSKDHETRKKAVDKLKRIDELERQAKIDRLKKEIKAGEYKVDPEELAKIIVDIDMWCI